MVQSCRVSVPGCVSSRPRSDGGGEDGLDDGTIMRGTCTQKYSAWLCTLDPSGKMWAREMEFVPPELSQGESYHVFCSYSSTDYQQTHALIQQLEDKGLRVCDHERDFTPGRPILDNMSESIQQSQKVLLILSAEFVRSRWCLLEANMSMFRDCLQRKPIVPVLLQRDLSIPLHLAHLTYLEVHQPDFRQQLLQVLCTPNQQMQGSNVVPYQPPSLYNGKSLEPLSAVNEEQLINKFDCGVWSDSVPDQLSLIIRQPERYREAIGIINTVAQKKVRFRSFWAIGLLGLGYGLVILFFVALVIILIKQPYRNKTEYALRIVGMIIFSAIAIGCFCRLFAFRKNEILRVLRELQKAIGQANNLLFEEHVLMGTQTHSKLLLVYVSVEGCRQELCAQCEDQEFFHAAIREYSCEYTCCLAKRYFPFQTTSPSGHLEGNVCFCQYVNHQLPMKQARRFNRCRKWCSLPKHI